MGIRITEARMIERATQNLLDSRGRVAKHSAEVASGVRVSRPSEDSAAWAEGKRVEARLLMSSASGDTVARATERLTETEAVFASIGNLLSRARQLAVQAANDTYGASERALIGVEVNSIRAAVLAAANTKASDGEYLLSGSLGGTEPFDTATGAFVGDSAVRSVGTADGNLHQASLSGARLTASSGVDVLAALQSFATGLSTNNAPGIRAAIDNIDIAVGQVARARAEGGVLTSAFEQADNARQDFDLVLQSIRARAVEADILYAASELAQSNTALEAAKAVSMRIMQLSAV